MGALLALVPLRFWLIGAAAVAALGIGLWAYHAIEQRGAATLQTQIDNQDRSAVNAAEQARSVRRACVDGGGVWDTSTGKCGQR